MQLMREANIRVDDDSLARMGIGELIELSRAAGLIDLRELACHGTGALVQVHLAERFDEVRLDALTYVDDWEHVAERPDGHVYLVAFTAPDLPDRLEGDVEQLIGTCDPEVRGEVTDLSLVGEQTDIAATIQAYEEAGITPDLRRLHSYSGGEQPLDALTDRQREVVSKAHAMGYYEVPRRVSIEDIAMELEVDPSTVAEHLQRAERNLIDSVF